MNNYIELFQKVSDQEKGILLNYLNGEKGRFVRDFVADNTMTVEFPSWQISFYSSEDIDNAIGLLGV